VSAMREQVEQRVRMLKAEHEAGMRMLAELEARQADLQQTVLRISGAIQVLEELLAAEAEAPVDRSDAGPPAGRAGEHDGPAQADGRLMRADA
jgi:hypothetical protein